MVEVRRNDWNPEAVQAVQQADTVTTAGDADEHTFPGAHLPEGFQLAFDRLQDVHRLGSPASAGVPWDRGMSPLRALRLRVVAYGICLIHCFTIDLKAPFLDSICFMSVRTAMHLSLATHFSKPVGSLIAMSGARAWTLAPMWKTT